MHEYSTILKSLSCCGALTDRNYRKIMPTRPPRKPGDPLIRTIDYTVRPDGCWVWNWSVHQKGYATVRVGKKGLKAHRVAYEMTYGPIPDGQIVRHLCGIPSCVNPEHLRAGTPAENARDMVNAGTQGHQKLTVQDADDIRRLFAEGNPSYAFWGRQFGVNWGTVRNIVLNKSFPNPSYQPREPSQRKSSRNQPDNTKADEATSPRPSLLSMNGPAPTGREEQKRRLHERLDSGRRPKHKAGDPVFTQDDWVVDAVNGCHNWKWGKAENRPFVTLDDGSRPLAYRATWQARFGPIPEGLSINHCCNNGRCVNTDHLNLGDHFDNMRDTVLAGNHVNQVLSFELAREIRNKYRPGITTYKMLAVEYGVSTWTIQGVLKNQTFHDPQYVPNTPEESVRRKLTMKDVTVIRGRYKGERVTMSQLGREYGVHQSVISDIVQNTYYHDPNYQPPPPNEVRSWKLSPDDVDAIITELSQGGVSQSSMAKKYRVDPSRIGQILRKSAKQ